MSTGWLHVVKPDWRLQGQEPDYRFSLANERTFLAWVRTALAILAGAVLLHEFAAKIEPRTPVLAVSIALSILAAAIGLVAYLHWRDNEIAMRHSQPLPHSVLIAMLSFGVLSLAVLVTLMVVV
jgi:putative membrane protein